MTGTINTQNLVISGVSNGEPFTKHPGPGQRADFRSRRRSYQDDRCGIRQKKAADQQKYDLKNEQLAYT